MKPLSQAHRRRLTLTAGLLTAVLSVTGARARPAAPALLLFGGEDHKVFLGCLNCAKTESGSLCNKFGDYGSHFDDKSIWNKFGTYGSRFNEGSPWNKFASFPPVIVDPDGNFYGYFTAVSSFSQRTTIQPLLELLRIGVEEGPQAARDALCDS